MALLGVVDELGLHEGVVLKVSGLVDAAVEGLGLGSIGGLAVGLSENILALDSGDVASVA